MVDKGALTPEKGTVRRDLNCLTFILMVFVLSVVVISCGSKPLGDSEQYLRELVSSVDGDRIDGNIDGTTWGAQATVRTSKGTTFKLDVNGWEEGSLPKMFCSFQINGEYQYNPSGDDRAWSRSEYLSQYREARNRLEKLDNENAGEAIGSDDPHESSNTDIAPGSTKDPLAGAWEQDRRRKVTFDFEKKTVRRKVVSDSYEFTIRNVTTNDKSTLIDVVMSDCHLSMPTLAGNKAKEMRAEFEQRNKERKEAMIGQEYNIKVIQKDDDHILLSVTRDGKVESKEAEYYRVQ